MTYHTSRRSARDEIAPELSGACTSDTGPTDIEASEGQSAGEEGSEKARVVALAAGWSHSLAVLSTFD